MLNGRRFPPFFKLTLVVLCAYILWSFNHPNQYLHGPKRYPRSVEVFPKNGGGKYHHDRLINQQVTGFQKVQESCSAPVTNVVFLKTHKTGSSTMSNIMLRFADTHNLTVALPLKDHWELGGYPAYIDKRLIDPSLPKYNIIGHHFRFNIEKLGDIMPDSTRYVTIIRSPVDNVESVFGFFQDQMPFIDWLEGIEADTAVRLKIFYDNPSKYYNVETDWYFRAKNHMFFDIGYDVSNDDSNYIGSKVNEMENIFTLVLLTDFFDESLIMMKNLLCWDWEDIIYIKFKMRVDDAKTEVQEDLAQKILKWNKADAMLYDFFNKTFWKKVEAYGTDRMKNDLEVFKRKQKHAEEMCIESYQPFKKKPWILGAKLRKKPSSFCKNLAASETVYGERLREKMYGTIEGLHHGDEMYKDKLFKKVAESAMRGKP